MIVGMNKSIAPTIKFLLSSLVCCTQAAPVLAQSSPPAPIQPGEVAVTEVLANAVNEATGEFVEVINTSDAVLDLSLFRFSDNSGVIQAIAPFARPLPFGIATTLLEPDQVALILDKDYAGEYDQRIAASVLDPAALVVVTTSQGYLSFANTADSVTLTGPTGIISDSFSWTADAGSEISFSRIKKISGELDVLAADPKGLSAGYVREEEIIVPPTPPTVVISELLPDATGSDDAEFIEIENTGAAPVNLNGLLLRDLVGDEFLLSGDLAAGGFLTFGPAQTGITLNNTGDSVGLLFTNNGTEQVTDTVLYPAASEGHSWSRFASGFAWTTQATPGVKNVLVPPVPTPGNGSSTPDEEATVLEESADSQDTVGALLVDSIKKVIELPAGTVLMVRGVVVTPVGVFFPKNFHVQDSSGGLLVKLPLDFKLDSKNTITVGQEVELVGKTAIYRDMPRLLLSSAPKIIGKKPVTVSKQGISAISDDDIGRLVTLGGTVSQRSGLSFKVKQGDDTMLVSVRAGSGITSKAPPKNTAVQVTGVVLRSGKQLVLAPRSSADLGGAGLVPTGSPVTPPLLLAMFLAFGVLARHLRPRSSAGSIKKF